MSREKLLASFICFLFLLPLCAQTPAMYYSDTSRNGVRIAKDPVVVYYKNIYRMYYSVPGDDGWFIGIATSPDLIHWTKTGELHPGAAYEKKGLCAPGAIVRNDTLHLFYQTYGNGSHDAICHAFSTDGLQFTRDATNPVFHPSGTWTSGRAIDAEVVLFKDKYFLFFATRDSTGTVQKQGAASTTLHSSFSRSGWQQLADSSILQPTLPWEKNCIEAATCTVKNNRLYMFYAGAYNNEPQQIGVAESEDGIHFKRLFRQPFLPNGTAGSWNESESGHPCIFKDQQGQYHLFFQGNNDKGKSWYLSQVKIGWKNNLPVIEK